MASNVKTGMGLGPSKVKLVADLTAEYKKLNDVLTKTKDLSDTIATNLKGMASGGGGGGASAMFSPSPQPGSSAGVVAPGLPALPDPPQRFNYGKAAATMAGSAVNAMLTSVDPSNYISNEVMRKQFGFYSGLYSPTNGNISNTAARMSAERMNYAGTSSGPLDAAMASMAGASNGMGPGLKNYRTIENSVAGISNMMPGVGLEGGMGAVTALNQGSSVNRLRMIGINVRDQNGFMRDVEDIARDLWNTLNKTKGGGKTKITESDLAFSLQPGNSVDMLLNQYFSGDAVLRQAVTAYLFQFAKNEGQSFAKDAQGRGYTSLAGKQALEKSGVLPQISQSIAGRNAAGFNVTDAYTGAGVGGVIGANALIQAASNTSATFSPVLSPLVGLTTFAQTIGSAGNGAGGILTKGVLDSVGGLAKGAVELAKIALTLNPELLAIVAATGTTIALLQSATDHMKDEITVDKLSGNYVDPSPGFDFSNGFVRGGGSGGSSSTGSGSNSGSKATTPTIKKGTGVATVNQIGFARALLRKLKITPNNDNVAAIAAWQMREDTKAKFNPLATTYDMPGDADTDFNDVGVKEYATMMQGVDATARTLQNIKGVGYDKILSSLKSGTQEDILKSVIASQWSGSSHYGNTFNTVTINLPKETAVSATAISEAVKDALRADNLRAAAQGTGSSHYGLMASPTN
jgi:hypothetical protein